MTRLKGQIRVLGIDDSPFDKFKDKEVLIIAALFRGGEYLDGVLSAKAEVDGTDATRKISVMINSSRCKPQIQAVFLDGIAVGGFNVIDIVLLAREIEIPVMVVMRRSPDLTNMKSALHKLGMEEKIPLLDKAGKVYSYNRIFFQIAGCTPDKAQQFLKLTCTHADIPEPLRIAHLIGSGVVMGESRGRA